MNDNNSLRLRPPVYQFIVVLMLFYFSSTFGQAAAVSGVDLRTMTPTGPVIDDAGILSTAAAQRLTLVATRLHEKAGVSIILATTSDIGDLPIEDYANSLYNTWGIGNAKTNEGVLILLVRNSRKIRIEVGYGSEGYITDADASQLIRTVGRAYLGNDDWDNGLSVLFSELARRAATEHQIPLTGLLNDSIPAMPVYATSAQDRSTQKLPVFAYVIIIILVLFLMSNRTGRAILWMLLLMSLSGGRGGGGGGFGGGGGGFGGFSGGRSGGGGSSGSF